MIVYTQYECQHCGEKFRSESECLKHEENCNSIVTFICDKCNRKIEWDEKDDMCFKKENQCHHINLGIPECGSKFDWCSVAFNLCDDYLYEFVMNLSKNCQNKIFDSAWRQ